MKTTDITPDWLKATLVDLRATYTDMAFETNGNVTEVYYGPAGHEVVVANVRPLICNWLVELVADPHDPLWTTVTCNRCCEMDMFLVGVLETYRQFANT